MVERVTFPDSKLRVDIERTNPEVTESLRRSEEVFGKYTFTSGGGGSSASARAEEQARQRAQEEARRRAEEEARKKAEADRKAREGAERKAREEAERQRRLQILAAKKETQRTTTRDITYLDETGKRRTITRQVPVEEKKPFFSFAGQKQRITGTFEESKDLRDIIYFGALGSTTRGFRVSKTPKTKVKFIADTLKKGDDNIVRVAFETKTGKQSTAGISKQIIKSGDEIKSIGKGVSISGTKTKRGTEFVRTEFIGTGRRVGQARAVSRTKGITTQKELGMGVSERALSADVLQLSKKGLRFPSTKPVIRQTIPDIKKVKGGLRYDLTSQDVIGFTTPTAKQGVVRFAGTTARPTRVLTKEGFKIRVPRKEFDISGIIKTGRAGTGDVVGVGKGITQKGVSKKIESQLSKEVTKSVSQQVGAIKTTAEKQALKQTSGFKIFTRPRIKPTIPQTPTETKTITRQIQEPKLKPISIQTPKQRDLSTPKIAQSPKVTPRTRTSSRATPRTQTDIMKRQTPLEKITPRTAQPQRSAQKQKTAIRQQQRFKQLLRSPNLQRYSTPKIRYPRPPIFPFMFSLPKAKPLMPPRMRDLEPKEDIILSEGFTARTLKLPKSIIKLSDIKSGKIKEDITGLGIRTAPIIIPDISNGNRKRRRNKR